METLSALPEWISDYRPAITASIFLCLLVLIQGLLGAIFGIVLGREEPGGKLQGDYNEFGYRTLRAHINSSENLPVFAFSLLLAMIVGASPGWVNWLAGLYVAARATHWIIYYAGIGPNNNGPRTMVFGLGQMFNLLLAGVAFFALYS
jgi:uncharacterized MAPEG superfamily protein